MGFDLLPDLHPRATRAAICVRVSRKWEYRGGTDDGPIQHVDLVLIDAKGNSMYGEIPANQIATHSHLIEENAVYVITRFRVSNAKRSFRPVAAPFMVEFTCRTMVDAVKEPVAGLPFLTYRLTPMDHLKPLANDNTNFVDVIGLLVEYSDTYTVQLPNRPGPTLTRHIILRDLSFTEVKVALWGERASAFSVEQFTPSEAKPVVILLVGCLMKKFQQNYYLSANTAARWYFNPQITEAREFYSSFQDQRVEIRHAPPPPQRDDQLRAPAQLATKSLLELNQMDPYDYTESGYRCTVTIARLVPNVSWWFASCTNCSKSCAVDAGGYRCNTCSCKSFRFKYKICFIALDGTDEAEMICFGDVARQIVGKPVQQVLRAATTTNPPPADIAKIVSRRFTFAVVLTQQSYYKEEKTYQVTSVIQSHNQDAPVLPLPLPPPAPAPIHNAAGPSRSGTHIAPGALQQSPPRANMVQTDISSATPSDSGHGSLVIDDTPPPSLGSSGKTPVKDRSGAEMDADGHPAARRKLFSNGEHGDEQIDSASGYDNDNDGLSDTADKEVDEKAAVASAKKVLVNKRSSRGGRGAAQESG